MWKQEAHAMALGGSLPSFPLTTNPHLCQDASSLGLWGYKQGCIKREDLSTHVKAGHGSTCL